MAERDTEATTAPIVKTRPTSAALASTREPGGGGTSLGTDLTLPLLLLAVAGALALATRATIRSLHQG